MLSHLLSHFPPSLHIHRDAHLLKHLLRFFLLMADWKAEYSPVFQEWRREKLNQRFMLCSGRKGDEGTSAGGVRKLTKRGVLFSAYHSCLYRYKQYLTQFREPGSNHSIDLIQDENDHQIYDDGGGSDGHPHVGLDLWVRAHRHECGDGDAVNYHTEHCRTGHSKLHR